MGKVELKLEVDAALVAQARAQGADLPAILEQGLRAALEASRAPLATGAEARARDWAEANRDAIAEHKRLMAQRGLFADSARRW